jgi:ribosomal protein L7Ae-like RNA K-turn-binding protein
MDLKMLSTDGNQYNLNDVKKENGTLVVFTCNTCPFVVMWEDRYLLLEKICNENNVGMVYVNSNEKKRDGDDSIEEMILHSKKNNYKAPYIVDKNSVLANAFNAKTTPHIFLFDTKDKLSYSGSIDDNYESAKDVSSFYLKDAILQMSNNKEITLKSTKPIGCSIKRIRK